MGTTRAFAIAALLSYSGSVIHAQQAPNRFAESRSPIAPQFELQILGPEATYGDSGLDNLPLLNENVDGRYFASE